MRNIFAQLPILTRTCVMLAAVDRAVSVLDGHPEISAVVRSGLDQAWRWALDQTQSAISIHAHSESIQPLEYNLAKNSPELYALYSARLAILYVTRNAIRLHFDRTGQFVTDVSNEVNDITEESALMCIDYAQKAAADPNTEMLWLKHQLARIAQSTAGIGAEELGKPLPRHYFRKESR